MEEERFEQQGFEVNEKGELEQKPFFNPQPLEEKPSKEVVKETIPEGCTEIKRSNMELGARSLFTPMELLDGNLLKISKKSRYKEDTVVQLCRKSGLRGKYPYRLQSDILVVPVAEYPNKPESNKGIFLCCFAVNLEDAEESAMVYHDRLYDLLTEEFPYLFVQLKSGVVKDFSEEKINKLSPELKEKYAKIKNDWDTKGERKIKLFGYDDD